MINNEQLKKLIKQLIFCDMVNSQADLATKLGYDRSTISGMTSGKKPITDSFANKVCEAYPVINKVWLLTGEGEMLKNPCEEVLKTSTEELEKDYAIMIPLLPIFAQGGSLNDFVVSVNEYDCEKVYSPIKGADFAITVSGDSMSPEYPSGSKVLIKKINETAFIDWGRCYVLDTCNGTVIKELRPSPKENYVQCVSLNQNQEKYAPFDVDRNDINGVYRVLMLLTEK